MTAGRYGLTRRALDKAGMPTGEINLFEVSEAFARLRGTGADPAKLNVHGGAIALGHSLGASGTRLLATLAHALRRRGQRWGLQTMCKGGLANATVVEAPQQSVVRRLAEPSTG